MLKIVIICLGSIVFIGCGSWMEGTCHSKDADICYELTGEDDILQCNTDEQSSYELDEENSCALLGYIILCNEDTLVEDGTELYAKNSCE